MFEEKLQEIGFNGSESRVYMELLRIGPQAVSIISMRLNMNRTTTYSVLKSLEHKGVVASYKNGNMKYFAANDPNSLIGYIDMQCRTFDYHRSELLSEIPRFRDTFKGYAIKKPVVSYFEGVEGVKRVMNDVVDDGSRLRCCISFHKWLESGLRDFLNDFKKCFFGRRARFSAIVPDITEARTFFEGFENILYVPAKDFSAIFENGMNISEDKVSIVHLDSGDEYGVSIQSKEIAGMHKVMFDMAWNGFKVKINEKV
ncbi:MAG: helix-turn-helix domain-containing protein [Candidatus Peregrinibacteria bacterium]